VKTTTVPKSDIVQITRDGGGTCTRTWRSHRIDDLRVIHHKQVPLLPTGPMYNTAASGIGIPQIWGDVIWITTTVATPSKTRSQRRPGGY